MTVTAHAATPPPRTAPLPGPATPTPHALAYRPDIDGLRAVAVTAVLLFHCWPQWFVSGFVGVDIFFVISGYLISTILLKQLEAGRFSILDFYSRRVRRIFPALLVVLLATLAFGWMVLLHGEFTVLGKHVAAGGGFVSNLVLWAESGYFDSSGNTKPLLHLWSLGVEEQFYIAWPLILWLVFTKRYNFLLVTGAIFCASMAVNLGSIASNPTAAFYSPLSRFWELMSGGVAAYLHLHRRPWSLQQQRWAAALGTLLMVGAFALIKPQALFPGWWALLPVAATFLLIMAGPATLINRHLLGNRLATGIGKISYPLYLWHWPLLSYAFILYGEKPSYLVKIGLMTGALLLAYLTYRLLETPLRHYRNTPRVVGALVTGVALTALIGFGINAGLLRERIDVHGSDVYLNALNDFDFPGASFKPIRHQGILFQQLTGKAPGLTVFIGDSLVQQYGPHMEQLMARQPDQVNSVIFATGGGCQPVLHTIRLPRFQFPLCPQTIAAAYDLASQPQVHTVMIGAAWYAYFNTYNNLTEYDTGSRILPFPSAAAQDLAYASLQQSVASLRKAGKRVVIVLQPPSGQAYDPRNMYQGSRLDSIYPLKNIPNVDLVSFNHANAAARARLIAIAAATGAELIDPTTSLCEGNTCHVLDASGAPVYTDTTHMRPSYSRRVANYLDDLVMPPRAGAAKAP